MPSNTIKRKNDLGQESNGFHNFVKKQRSHTPCKNAKKGVLSKNQLVCEKRINELELTRFPDDRKVIELFRRQAISKSDEKILLSFHELKRKG